MMEKYYDALALCLVRYHEMITSDPMATEYDNHRDLLSFIREFDEAITNRLPLIKLNRWLGYIQGVMIERGLTTVETERDWTRPLFRPIDFAKPSLGKRLINAIQILMGRPPVA